LIDPGIAIEINMVILDTVVDDCDGEVPTRRPLPNVPGLLGVDVGPGNAGIGATLAPVTSRRVTEDLPRIVHTPELVTRVVCIVGLAIESDKIVRAGALHIGVRQVGRNRGLFLPHGYSHQLESFDALNVLEHFQSTGCRVSALLR
jgi:hypothetical protein